MIKKLFVFIITLFFVCNLASCSTAIVRNYGVYGYSRTRSSIGLSENLIPFLNEEDQYDKSFLSVYPYIDVDYYRSYPSYSLMAQLLSTIKDPELEIMYLIYDPETYAQAKTCALEKLQLSQENVFEYNNYHFIENTAIRSKSSQNCFPEIFNLFGYNDEKRTLIFIGYYIGMIADDYKSDLQGLNPFDIEVFLKTYFSQFYDFDS